MSLSEHYRSALKQPGMVHDAVQEQAIIKLEALGQRLSAAGDGPVVKVFGRLSPFKKHRPQPVRGLYLWGGVGRGKTWLMNLFYEELEIKQKCRIHFHHFMLDVHENLDRLSRQNTKQKDPLRYIAGQLAKSYRVLCIDEFIVTNITDAMILSELLHALFKHEVCLVATSNRVPDDLYLNGLQRERFLPAIEMIKTHTEVFHLDDGVDHRLKLLEQSGVYYFPIKQDTGRHISQRLSELAITPLVKNRTLHILGREIKTVCSSEEVAWFEFESICNAPRAAQDYIELAQQFNTIIVSNIPVFDEYSDDKARRFIYLIDELYDRNVKLVASAHAAPEDLYQGDMLKFAFNRTRSRLIEMRSHQYLSKEHRPF